MTRQEQSDKVSMVLDLIKALQGLKAHEITEIAKEHGRLEELLSTRPTVKALLDRLPTPRN